MSTTTRGRQQKTAPVFGFKAVEGEPDGTFEAYVSVFGNVDLAKERVVEGAFKGSLARWKSSGDPIPVIFSHQWDNLDAHVGTVVEAEERAAGDARLPTELAGLGGLWVMGSLELDEDFAARLWRKMAKRAIKEFSFAYDVLKAKPGADGAALDLTELDLIEVGPTLKGMNPDTVLVNAKAAQDAGLGPLEVLDLAASMSDALAGEKRLPSGALDGAVESTLDAIRQSATIWAELEYGRDLYALHLEATFLEEDRALVTAERWEDPWGEGPVWELSYLTNDDGTVSIDVATELEVTIELAPKRAARRSRTFAELSALSRKLAPLGDAAGVPEPTASDGKADASQGKADDPTSGAPAPTAGDTPLGVIAQTAELADALS